MFKAQSRASVSLLFNSRTNVILILTENYKLCLYLLAWRNFHTFDRPFLMFFIVMVLVKCSISFKFATAVQSIRRSHHPNNAMICDIIYSTVLFLGTCEYCHTENEHHLRWQILPPCSTFNEYISKWGTRLNKFHVISKQRY